MKSLMRWAASLYPAWWRARYADEFNALIEDSRGGAGEVLDVLFGAMKMQLTRGTYWKFGCAAAVMGFLVAGAFALRAPYRYEATTTLHSASTAPMPNPLTRAFLTQVMSRPSLDLYHTERMQIPIEDVVFIMRNDLHVTRERNEVRISFTYPNAEKAKATVLEVARLLQAGDPRESKAATLWRIEPPAGGIEVVSRPSLPDRRIRMRLVVAGTFLGLLVGLASAAFVRHPKAVRPIVGFALAGGAAAAILALLLPDSYLSTAVLRVKPANAESAGAAPFNADERIAGLIHAVLTRDNLLAIIQRPSLNLYREERARRPIDDVVDQMRREVKIRPVLSNGAFTISYAYPDRFKAQAVVRELVTKLVEQNVIQARESTKTAPSGNAAGAVEVSAVFNLEVLDPASAPLRPSYPNRPQMAVLAAVVTALLAALTMALRHRRTSGPRLA